MSKYASLDDMLIAGITNQPGIMFEALAGDGPVAIRAEALAKEENAGKKSGAYEIPAWRVVDRRLQALRKAGKIKYGRGKAAGWKLVDVT